MAAVLPGFLRKIQVCKPTTPGALWLNGKLQCKGQAKVQCRQARRAMAVYYRGHKMCQRKAAHCSRGKLVRLVFEAVRSNLEFYNFN